MSSNYQCNECNKTAFSREDSLKRHILRLHNKVAKTPCDTCGKSFYDKHSLKKHKQTIHEGLRNYKCDICLKLFAQACDLKYHIKAIHKKEKDFKCTVCGKGFSDKRRLSQHKRCNTKEDKSEYLFESKDVGIMYKCLQKNCAFMVTDKVSLQNHVTKEHKDIICIQCGKNFHHSSSLKRHIDSIHSSVKFICNTCKKVFQWKNYLKIHTKRNTCAKDVILHTQNNHSSPIGSKTNENTDKISDGLEKENKSIKCMITELEKGLVLIPNSANGNCQIDALLSQLEQDPIYKDLKGLTSKILRQLLVFNAKNIMCETTFDSFHAEFFRTDFENNTYYQTRSLQQEKNIYAKWKKIMSKDHVYTSAIISHLASKLFRRIIICYTINSKNAKVMEWESKDNSNNVNTEIQDYFLPWHLFNTGNSTDQSGHFQSIKSWNFISSKYPSNNIDENNNLIFYQKSVMNNIQTIIDQFQKQNDCQKSNGNASIMFAKCIKCEAIFDQDYEEHLTLNCKDKIIQYFNCRRTGCEKKINYSGVCIEHKCLISEEQFCQEIDYVLQAQPSKTNPIGNSYSKKKILTKDPQIVQNGISPTTKIQNHDWTIATNSNGQKKKELENPIEIITETKQHVSNQLSFDITSNDGVEIEKIEVLTFEEQLKSFPRSCPDHANRESFCTACMNLHRMLVNARKKSQFLNFNAPFIEKIILPFGNKNSGIYNCKLGNCAETFIWNSKKDQKIANKHVLSHLKSTHRLNLKAQNQKTDNGKPKNIYIDVYSKDDYDTWLWTNVKQHWIKLESEY